MCLPRAIGSCACPVQIHQKAFALAMPSLVAVVVSAAICPKQGMAVTRSWSIGNGSFNSAASWGGNPPPTSTDDAAFNRGGFAYQVSFPASVTTTNLFFQVGSDQVTFDLN